MLPLGFLPPCPPIKAPQPPSGDIWLPEIKLDGFRMDCDVLVRTSSSRGRTASGQ
jgi:hypothetical protein